MTKIKIFLEFLGTERTERNDPSSKKKKIPQIPFDIFRDALDQKKENLQLNQGPAVPSWTLPCVTLARGLVFLLIELECWLYNPLAPSGNSNMARSGSPLLLPTAA